MLSIAIGLIAAWLVFEIVCWCLHRALRARFQWLIGSQDACPTIPPDLVEKYAETSFDAELGWVRRARSVGEDRLVSKRTRFHIDATGARLNPGFEGRESAVAVYGDSYAFCRLVDDDETWPHLLSRRLGTDVRNLGVGNYGFDQALLRLERELGEQTAATLIVAVVPETICRVRSYWKHYFEYGNVLAFKPKFEVIDGALRLLPSAIADPRDFFSIPARRAEIEARDPFYAAKFRRDVLAFPYLAKLLRRAPRHLPIVASLIGGALRGDFDAGARRAFDRVMAENARWTARLYREPEARDLLRRLILRFAERCARNRRRPILLILPQPVDLAALLRGEDGYRRFFASMTDHLTVLDMSERFLAAAESTELYVEGALGPHVSTAGNALIADALAEIIKA